MKISRYFVLPVCVLLMTTGNVMAESFGLEKNETAKQTTDDEHPLQLNRFKDNWFIGVNGGTSFSVTNLRFHGPVKNLFGPTINFNFGKWFSPVFGFRFNIGWTSMGAMTHKNSGKLVKEEVEPGLFRTRSNILGVTGEAMLNLTDVIYGYKEDRLYSAIPFLSAGVLFNPTTTGNDVTFGIGLHNRFKVTQKWSVDLSARADAFSSALINNEGGSREDCNLALTVGGTYHFGKRNWTAQRFSQHEMDEMQEKLVAMNEERDALQQKVKEQETLIAQAAQAPKEVIVEKKVKLQPMTVFFSINKSTLSKNELLSIGMIASTIKSMPERKFRITGYADNATGNARFNKKVSKGRAQFVYDTLVKVFDVNPDQLEQDYKGGTDNMFYDDARYNRVALVEEIE